MDNIRQFSPWPQKKQVCIQVLLGICDVKNWICLSWQKKFVNHYFLNDLPKTECFFLSGENFFKGGLYLKFLRIVNNKQSVPASVQMHLSVLDFQLQIHSTDYLSTFVTAISSGLWHFGCMGMPVLQKFTQLIHTTITVDIFSGMWSGLTMT